MVRLRLLFACLLIATLVAAQPKAPKEPEYHLTADAAHQLYVNSVFAHGHRHGYEEGFHDAEVDLQMGRGFREFESPGKAPKMVGYVSEFGSKKLFRAGSEYGYLAGYSDSAAGRPFRMLKPAKAANKEQREKRSSF